MAWRTEELVKSYQVNQSNQVVSHFENFEEKNYLRW